MTHKLYLGDCLDVMKGMDDNSIDFVVTDSPFGISFMSKKWDQKIPPLEYWAEMLRICKPGGYIAAAGLPRMIHRLTCVIEDSGWVIKDMLMYLFGVGFPKSHNHYGLEGYGSSLKPAWEGWILAMKPLDGTYKQNVERWGIGGLNIDKARISCADNLSRTNISDRGYGNGWGDNPTIQHPRGRWPSNLLLNSESAALLDRESGILKSGSGNRRPNGGGQMFDGFAPIEANFEGSSGGASRFFKVIDDDCPNRFFYSGKASQRERSQGLDKPSSHPTVKPISLMKYIITLLAPPNNPTLLDPFMGSGSTLIAAVQLGINCIGIEKEPEYFEIAQKRIEYHAQKNNAADVREVKEGREALREGCEDSLSDQEET